MECQKHSTVIKFIVIIALLLLPGSIFTIPAYLIKERKNNGKEVHSGSMARESDGDGT